MHKSVQISLVVAAMLSAGCYDRHTMPAESPGTETPTVTIAEFARQCDGGVTEIDVDAIIAGRVTTSDEEGNFYKSFFIEDSSGGIEIMAGTYDIHNRYPEGVEVSVRLMGCATAQSDGVVRIGLPAEDYSLDEVAYFESDVLLDRHIMRGTTVVDVTPATIGITDADADKCGRLVRVRKVRYVPDKEDSDRTCMGFRRFEDAEGNGIYTSVSEYADFAGMEIPDSELAVCGILQYGHVTGIGERYIIKPRSAGDYETDEGDNGNI